MIPLAVPRVLDRDPPLDQSLLSLPLASTLTYSSAMEKRELQDKTTFRQGPVGGLPGGLEFVRRRRRRRGQRSSSFVYYYYYNYLLPSTTSHYLLPIVSVLAARTRQVLHRRQERLESANSQDDVRPQ